MARSEGLDDGIPEVKYDGSDVGALVGLEVG